MKAKHLIVLILTAMFVIAFGAEAAHADPLTAAFSLRYRNKVDGALNWNDWITIDDNAATDFRTDSGAIGVMGAADIWSFVFEVGQGGSNANNPDYPLPNLNLDLSSDITLDSGGTGWLEIQLSQANLTPAASGWSLTFNPLVDSGLSATATAFVNASNELFGTSHPADSYSGGTPYSLTLDLTVAANNASSGASASGDAVLKPVPEPNTLLLLGMGLVFCGALRLGSKSRNIGRV